MIPYRLLKLISFIVTCRGGRFSLYASSFWWHQNWISFIRWRPPCLYAVPASCKNQSLSQSSQQSTIVPTLGVIERRRDSNCISAGPCFAVAYGCGSREISCPIDLLICCLLCYCDCCWLDPKYHEITVPFRGTLTSAESRRPSENRCQNSVQKVTKNVSDNDPRTWKIKLGDVRILCPIAFVDLRF